MLIDSFEASKILKAHKERKNSIKVHLNLGITEIEVLLKGDRIEIGEYAYNLRTITKIAKDQSIFELAKKPIKIAFFDQRYYKLEPLKDSAPTIEIDGIRMHRTKNLKPLEDAQLKIKWIGVRKGENVLDICTGLGYTAIESFRKGAKVTTIEKDPNVIEIANKNPFSSELFEGIDQKKLELIQEDASIAVKSFKEESFDAILHDPPRFSLAGELYSEDFYRELYRILRKGGRVLHYVGSPGSKYRGKDFIKGVQKRLISAGFRTKKTPDGESILAYK